jgi:predicted DNA-binding protein
MGRMTGEISRFFLKELILYYIILYQIMITSIIGINMRTIVDIPDSQVKILDQVSKKKNVSRASLIREALTKYINSYSNSKKSYELAFGVWKRKKLDSFD